MWEERGEFVNRSICNFFYLLLTSSYTAYCLSSYLSRTVMYDFLSKQHNHAHTFSSMYMISELDQNKPLNIWRFIENDFKSGKGQTCKQRKVLLSSHPPQISSHLRYVKEFSKAWIIIECHIIFRNIFDKERK